MEFPEELLAREAQDPSLHQAFRAAVEQQSLGLGVIFDECSQGSQLGLGIEKIEDQGRRERSPGAGGLTRSAGAEEEEALAWFLEESTQYFHFAPYYGGSDSKCRSMCPDCQAGPASGKTTSQ